MTQHYATYRRQRSKVGGKGRLDYARIVDDIMLPDVALTITLDGPLITKPTTIHLHTISPSRFDVMVNGKSIGQGGRMECFKIIASRIPSRFSTHGE